MHFGFARRYTEKHALSDRGHGTDIISILSLEIILNLSDVTFYLMQVITLAYRSLGLERVFLLLDKMANTPFHIQEDAI